MALRLMKREDCPRGHLSGRLGILILPVRGRRVTRGGPMIGPPQSKVKNRHSSIVNQTSSFGEADA